MKTYQLALAAAVLMGSSSIGLAEEWRMDPTYDHIYYYGPVKQQSAAQPANPVRHVQTRPAEVQRDTTADHIYYYGPVAH